MPRKGKRKRNNKYEYEIHKEPICECLECGNVHLRRQRKEVVPKGDDRILSILVCPKCGGEGYLYAGDKETKRRIKTNELQKTTSF